MCIHIDTVLVQYKNKGQNTVFNSSVTSIVLVFHVPCLFSSQTRTKMARTILHLKNNSTCVPKEMWSYCKVLFTYNFKSSPAKLWRIRIKPHKYSQ